MVENKQEVVLRYLTETGFDWVLISDSIEVRYITGLKSSNMYLLIGKESTILFTDFRYREKAQRYCEAHQWKFVELQQSALAEIVSHAQDGDTIAIQSNSLTVDQFNTLSKSEKSVDFKCEGKSISALFSIKSDQEIENIRQAASIADAALERWIPQLNEKMSEREAADLLETLCKSGGSEGPSFDTIVLFGPRSALPHGTPQSNVFLTEGDTILVDFGCTINGFCSDMTRTFYFRSVPDNLRERYEITLTAQKAGVVALAQGKTASEIDTIVRDIITEAGYGEAFGHGTGHGVGLRIHEQPSLNRHDTTVLQAGMVVTVEPGIYIPSEGGVRIEDLLVVTETGCETLSKSPKELQIIG